MAHFAELKVKTDPTGFTSDAHQVVERVVVVGNDVATSDGPLGVNDMHVDGEQWCIDFFKGGIWKQTSYNGSFRKSYAGPGMVYDQSKDKFLSAQPHASWTLDENDDWQAPVAIPKQFLGSDPTLDNVYIESSWDEDNQRWIGLQQETSTDYIWNPSSSEWEVE